MAIVEMGPTEGTVPAYGGLTEFPNAVRDAPEDPTVLSLVEDTSTFVQDVFAANRLAANSALSAATTAISNLVNAALPPALPDPPPAPAIITTAGASFGLGFDALPNLGTLAPQSIDEFEPNEITIPSIEDDMPEYTSLGVQVVLPDAPVLVLPPEPTEPGLDLSFDIPEVPAKSYGGSPDLDEITLPVYVAPTIPVFGDAAPEFTTLPPDPFLNWTEPEYLSSMKDAVEDVLLEMLDGGTGLPADVEQAIWERARQREDNNTLKVIDLAVSQWSSRGFDHPQGQLADLAIATAETGQLKINELSRDVAIKQADLEQSNRQFAVDKALAYEQIYVGVFLAIVERNFQMAKFGVETQIQIYNLSIAAFNAQNAVFASKIAKYRVDLDGALAYLKTFEALVELEKAKTQVNLAKVQAYDAQVRAYGQEVEAYKAVVQAEVAKGELQKNLVEVYKAQIDAMIAKINGQRAKFEAYGEQVKGETAKIQLEDANARVYQTQVQAWGEKATVTLKRTDVQLQENRQTLEWNIANMQRITGYSGQQLNVIQANLSAFQANVSRATARYSADAESARFNLQAQVSLSQVAIAKYQALLEQWKVRAGEVIQFGTVQAESVRAAALMLSNIASGLAAGTHASAGLSAGTSASQSSSRSSSDSTNNSKSVSESAGYSIAHNYQHRA